MLYSCYLLPPRWCFHLLPHAIQFLFVGVQFATCCRMLHSLLVVAACRTVGYLLLQHAVQVCCTVCYWLSHAAQLLFVAACFYLLLHAIQFATCCRMLHGLLFVAACRTVCYTLVAVCCKACLLVATCCTVGYSACYLLPHAVQLATCYYMLYSWLLVAAACCIHLPLLPYMPHSLVVRSKAYQLTTYMSSLILYV